MREPKREPFQIKTDLEHKRDEVDRVVKEHHAIYDKTDWTTQPTAFILGYQGLLWPSVEKILKEIEQVKTDLKHVREEAVMKESLANKKIGDLDAKMSRHIREAVPTTTRDVVEFNPSKTAPRPAETTI